MTLPMAHTDNHLVELRGMAPRELVEVLDIISAARRQSRIELVLEVLQQWTDARVHAATLIARLQTANPRRTDGERMGGP